MDLRGQPCMSQEMHDIMYIGVADPRCLFDPWTRDPGFGTGFFSRSWISDLYPKSIFLRFSEIFWVINIYVPMIYTAPCIMFWMCAYPSLREVGGGWALEFSSFLGPVKWHRADRRVPSECRLPWRPEIPLFEANHVYVIFVPKFTVPSF
jgi:hypothetical protein